MKLRFSLADKISTTIVIVGIFTILLVYYICNSYRTFAYQHHTQALQQLAYLEIKDLMEDLKTNSLDLALSIEHESDFQLDYRYQRIDDLTQQLNNQFYQYFVTAGVLKLLKLYILDTNFTLISISSEGINTDLDGELICPQLSQLALSRHGSEKLQTLSSMCLYKNTPVFAVIVPFGGLNPTGYIQVITDLAYNLQRVEHALAMPIEMNLLDGKTIYQSEYWQSVQHNKNYLDITLPILDHNSNAIMHLTLKADMTAFNREILDHRNWIMAIAFTATAFTVLIVLLILRKSTIPPLSKIHDVLEKIHQHFDIDNYDGRLLFEQLLEQIIQLRRKRKTRFSVMVLDLNHFREVNRDFGTDIGDQLLIKVEQRLAGILRDSDMISWVGTDTPGHKLLPTDSKTQYRATIARLGGDEFGLLLPSAQTEEQATAVAARIVETLSEAFQINKHEIHLECKIGISIYPIHGEDEKQLIRNADKAMYQARSNNQTLCVFQHASDKPQ